MTQAAKKILLLIALMLASQNASAMTASLSENRVWGSEQENGTSCLDLGKLSSESRLGFYDVKYVLASGASLVTKGKRESLVERAEALQQRLPSGNRASIPHPGGRLNVDLAGKSHHVKGTGEVPTPHVVEFKNNIIPSGPRAGQVGSRSQVGPTRPATAADLRLVDRWLKSKGR